MHTVHLPMHTVCHTMCHTVYHTVCLPSNHCLVTDDNSGASEASSEEEEEESEEEQEEDEDDDGDGLDVYMEMKSGGHSKFWRIATDGRVSPIPTPIAMEL